MSIHEILLISETSGLRDALALYEGLTASDMSARRALSAMRGDPHPHAVYIEDPLFSISELWDLIHEAQRFHISVLLGVHSTMLARVGDLNDAGIAYTTERGADKIGPWIGQTLGLRSKHAKEVPIVAIGGAKGGIGKTTVTCLVANGLRLRGLRVLVVDGDISNSGIRPSFRIPAGVPTFLQIRTERGGAWTPENVRKAIYHHELSGIDFLLAGDESNHLADITYEQWGYFMRAVRAQEGYDIILLDTGPELRKRPYAIDAAAQGGLVILPCPPGRKEREGVGNALNVFQTEPGDLTDHCMLLFMEPEKGVKVTIKQIMPMFAGAFPKVRVLGSLPRNPAVLSAVDEHQGGFINPLGLGRYTNIASATHVMVDSLLQTLGIAAPHPMPREGWFNRTFRKNQVALPGAAAQIGQIAGVTQ